MEQRIGGRIGIEIRTIMSKELGQEGLTILNEVCTKHNIRLENISPGAIMQLVTSLNRTIKEKHGFHKGEEITKKIQKLKALVDLEGVAKDDRSDTGRRKLVNAYVNMGNVCSATGEFDEAETYYRRALNITQNFDYKLKESEALRNTAHIYKETKRWEDAERYYNKSISLGEKTGNAIGMADAYRGLGYIGYTQGRYDKSLECYNLAVEFAEKTRDRDTIGTAYIDMGMVYSDTGDMDKTIEQFEKAIPILEEVRNHQQVSRAYNNLGDTHLQREEWDKAIEDFDKCREVASIIQHERYVAWSLFNAGEALAKSGNPEQAIKNSLEAIEILERIKDDIGALASYRVLFIAYGLKKNWKEAEENFEKAKSFLETGKSPMNEGHLYLEWGNTLALKGDEKESKTFLIKARDIFKRIGANKFLKKAETALGEE